MWELAKVIGRNVAASKGHNHNRSLKKEIHRDLRRAIKWRHAWSFEYTDKKRSDLCNQGNSPLIAGRRWAAWPYHNDKTFAGNNYPGVDSMLAPDSLPAAMVKNAAYNKMLAMIMESFWDDPPVKIGFAKKLPGLHHTDANGQDVTIPARTKFSNEQFMLYFGTTDPNPGMVSSSAIPSKVATQRSNLTAAAPKRRRTGKSTDPAVTTTGTTTKAAAAAPTIRTPPPPPPAFKSASKPATSADALITEVSDPNAASSGFRSAPAPQRDDGGASSSAGAVPTGAPRSFGPSANDAVPKAPFKARPRCPGPSKERYSLKHLKHPYGTVEESGPVPTIWSPLGPDPDHGQIQAWFPPNRLSMGQASL